MTAWKGHGLVVVQNELQGSDCLKNLVSFSGRDEGDWKGFLLATVYMERVMSCWTLKWLSGCYSFWED